MAQPARSYEGPGCPRCWTPLPHTVLEAGEVYCGTCALVFTAKVFTPPARAQLRLQGGSPDQAQCARHARNAAVAACERCGAFMCGLCRIDSDALALCAPCFERLRSEDALESARTTFRSWRTLGLHLALLGMFMWPLGIIIGPAALVAAARGIAQGRKRGDEGGAFGTVLSIVVGALVTLGGMFFLLTLTHAFHRR